MYRIPDKKGKAKVVEDCGKFWKTKAVGMAES